MSGRGLRSLGFIALAGLAVASVIALKPADTKPFDKSQYGRLIDAAMSDYRANDVKTKGAPQQDVVNGWVARDLLEIQAREIADLLALNSENRRDNRVPVLLLLGVIALCWHGLTIRWADRQDVVQSPTVNGGALAADPTGESAIPSRAE